MAFFDEDEENPQVDGPISTGAPSSVIGAGGLGSTQQSKGLTPDKPGNFVGIQKYLDANKSQAGKLGDQAASVIGKNVNEAKSSLNSLTDKFKSSVGSAPTLNQSDLDTLNKDPSLLNQNQLSSLKSVYDASYKGPNSLTDYSDDYINTQKKFENTKQLTDASKTEPGRQALIEQINNKPRSKGATVFDSVLLSSGGGRQKIEDEASKARSFLNSNAIGDAESQAGQYKDSVANAINANKAQVQSAAKTQAKTLADQIAASLTKKRTDAKNLDAELKADLGDTTLSDATLNFLRSQSGTPGTPDYRMVDEGLDTYGLNLGASPYYTGIDDVGINTQNTASAQDYAKNKALEALIGSDISSIMGSNYLDQGNASQAGTARLSPSFDSKKLYEDIFNEGNKYNDKYYSPGFVSKDFYTPSHPGGGEIPRPGPEPDYGWSSITGIPDLSQASARDIEFVAIPKLEAAANKKQIPVLTRQPGSDNWITLKPGQEAPAGWPTIYDPNSVPNPGAGALARDLKAKLDQFKTDNKKSTPIQRANPKRN